MIHAQELFDAYLQAHPAPKSQAFRAGLIHGFAECTGELSKGIPSPFQEGTPEDDAWHFGVGIAHIEVSRA